MKKEEGRLRCYASYAQLLNPGGSTLQLAGSGCSSSGSGLARRPSLQGHPKQRPQKAKWRSATAAGGTTKGMGQTIRLLTLEASFMLLRRGPTTSKNTGAPSHERLVREAGHEYTIDTSGFRVVCKCSRCIFISRLRRLYLQNLARFLVWALLSAIIFRRAAIHANHSNITD